ncbi:MerR family transcriptional regulator [Nitrospina sp. 32_T5]|uniref:MerR family transcriptional regulator n=1 Tax=unclassified Nitrospina TaxID=2638683 RepID=UPI003F977498
MSLKLPDKLFFKIGEVAEIAGVEQHVLRYWEDEFEELKPDKNRSGQRLYQKKDIERILEIKQLLYHDKYTIAGAKQRLKQRRKGASQLDFGFDRSAFVDLKNRIQQELESLLEILEKK